jgi:hypothetical protein
MDECLYKDTSKLNRVKTIFKKYFPDYKTNIENWMIKKSDGPIIKLFQIIVDRSPFMKDFSFRQEEEYRIVYNNNGENIQFDEGKTLIKPYYEGDLKDEKGKLPVSEIWVGPTPHKELSELSVRKLLDKYGYGKVDVKISKIPYRPL